MKYLFILILIPFTGKTQVYQAGTVFPYYYDISPDTLVNIPGNYNPAENYYFDVNGDLTSDFKMEAWGGYGLGGGSRYITFIPLNSNSHIRFGRVDSTWHNFPGYWMLVQVAKPLQLGDSINSKLSSWRNTALYLYDNSGSAGSFTNMQDWVSANDLYIGVKYQNAADTIYGWIRVNCPTEHHCYVKDFSISKCLNIPSLTVVSSSSLLCSSESATLTASGANSYTWSTGNTTSSIIITPTVTTIYSVQGLDKYGCSTNSIVTTQNVNACVGIQKHERQEIKIYPNPISDILHLETDQLFENSQIEITNYLGQTVLKSEFKNQIDVSKLAAGINTLKIITKESQSYLLKFVKE